MATIQATIDSVRAAVSSTATCTPTIVATLDELLLPNPHTANSSKPITTNTAKTTKARSNYRAKPMKTPAAIARAKKAGFVNKENENEHGDTPLSQKERSILATEVINAALKSLTEAIKAPVHSTVRQKVSSKGTGRKALRRSSSVPQSPLQPRSLNRVTSPPSLSSRASRSSSSASASFSICRPTADCARIAFACLRALSSAKIPGVNFPELQLENGMSVLIGKLLSLGLDDLALKELRLLKSRLVTGDVLKKAPAPKRNASTPAQDMAELLDFGDIQLTGAKLGLVISTQLQILRLMASSRLNNAQNSPQVLDPSSPSSPTKFLLLAAKESKSTDKIARQLQTLSDILLSLCPSVSPSDDSMALEPKLSVSPDVAFRLQTFALHNRILWWNLAGHKADYAKELFDPFLRCLSTFARRGQRGVADTVERSSAAFTSLRKSWEDRSDASYEGLWPTLFGIYRLLGTLAQESNLIEEAIHWTLKLEPYNEHLNTVIKRGFVIARLVALTLKRQTREPKDEELILLLLEILECPFKGESSEIEDLLTELSSARRVTIAVISRATPTCPLEHRLSDGMRQMCETLVFQSPRICLRYLGKMLDGGSTTKDIVRYEQRRQFIAKSGLHSIDSSLFLVRTLLGEGRISWDLLDSKLQDCLSLLGHLDLDSIPNLKESNKVPSYHVRISHLYYTHFVNERRNSESSKDSQQLRVLRRSVDCMRGRPQPERESAMLPTKLERIAELYKNIGRYDELFQTLKSVRDEMISYGTLSNITVDASVMPMQLAWGKDDASSTLARTVQSLLKVRLKHLNSTTHELLSEDSWSDEERAAMAELQLNFLCNQSKMSTEKSRLQTTMFRSLLSIYDREHYPIRRLRVLICLMSLRMDCQEEFAEFLQHDLQADDVKSSDVEGSNDESLEPYLAHLHTLGISILELQCDNPQSELFIGCLVKWAEILKSCKNAHALELRIDNIPVLLDHLHSLAECMQVKGFNTARIAVLQLIADFNEVLNNEGLNDDGVSSLTNLGSQWLQLGYSGKARLAFDRAKAHSHQNGVSALVNLQLNLAYAEYLLAIGNYEKAEDHLNCAQVIHSQETSPLNTHWAIPLQESTKKNVLLSEAYFVYSKLALERGAAHTALNHAKQSVRLLRRAWANTEEQVRRKSQLLDGPQSEIEKLTENVSELNMSTTSVSADTTGKLVGTGACFWALITPLFRGFNHLSEVYAHHGMFQETIYYAEQGYKLVKQVGSDSHQAMAAAIIGNTLLRAGTLDRGSEMLIESQRLSASLEYSRDSAMLAYYLGNMHGLLGDHGAEIAAYGIAQETLDLLINGRVLKSGNDVRGETGLEEGMSKLALSKAKMPAKRKPATRAKVTTKSKKEIATKEFVTETIGSISEEFMMLVSLKSTVLRQKAQISSLMKQCGDSIALLHQAGVSVKTQLETVDHGLAMAKHLLFQSLEQMTGDPVYSVLQDSTISFPSVTGVFKYDRVGERLSATKVSPPRKQVATRGARDVSRSRSPAPDGFFDKLRQAQEHLMEVYSTALVVASVGLIHKISALLNSVSILLSASGYSRGKSMAHPGFASCTIELARTLALRRERKAIQIDPPSTIKSDDSCWPTSSPDSRRASLAIPQDMPRFQRDYVDIIPKTWTAISISLSDSRNELSITKFQAGQNPFVLRLPLGRHNSMDADEEVFGFEQGRSELSEIIQLANESAHDARSINSREAKVMWWEEREALDARLMDLLENIEKVWLGGFTGIFSQHTRRPDLLAQFQKSFQNILDKHLPSRQKKAKRNASPRVSLDSRILDLFIGLGDASAESSDLSEPLTDLLYFVVDVLQFHGELNAYAEIDFDSIVVETNDALRCYHETVHASNYPEEGRHTILVLDKSLHSFPWESLPCMYGQPVSRLPSLGCLQDRIIAQQNGQPDNSPEGTYINPASGSYILNPSDDLKNTQATFQKGLQDMKNWDGVVRREPTEEEFKAGLENKDLFLYFGHGSGAQYIRAREIRRLDKCAVTFLMGCSSGSLVEAGEFEPYGPAINYMHGGSPALVATLWDVTDKDIDRFAKSTFEQWGLFKSESKSEKKGRGRKKTQTATGQMSLIEAVAKSREVCTLKFLNAAAVCVYGVPVYLK